MGDNPWQLLGLDPRHATERDVKAAYARLLKQHRPERDPEGFRMVRSAYEQAMHGIGKASGEGSQDAQKFQYDLPAKESTTPAADFRSADQPETPEWQQALQQLKGALKGDNQEALQAAWQGFVRQSRVDRMPMRQEAQAMWSAFQGDVERLAACVTSSWLLRCIELGLPEIPRALVRHWDQTSNAPRLVALGEEMVLEIRQAHAEESLQVIAQLVQALVFWDAQLACDLVALVGDLIPEARAREFRGSLQHSLSLGRIFQDVPSVQRAFWKQALHQAPAEVAWDSPAAQEALAWVRKNRDRKSVV